jgi:hypothetical protein
MKLRTKILILSLITFASGVLLYQSRDVAMAAFGQTAQVISPFIYTSPIPTITPSISSSTLKLPSLGGSGNRCLRTTDTGVVEATGADCSVATAETTGYVRDGYSARFSESVLVTTVAAALDQIFNFIYVAPAVTLSASPSGTTKEYGDPINAISFSATTVKKTNPITSVDFYRGTTYRGSSYPPNPNGGIETFSETLPVSSSVIYYAKVSDGTSTTTSIGITYTYVYPFYYGVGAEGLTCSQVQALTKSVKSKSNTTVVTSPASQVYYFAYPASYGNLTSILDTNLFETISDYTKRTVNCTMLDSTTQIYYIYEFNNITTQTNFSNQYKF